ncbi:MAG TPA: lysine 2,3-aminomutase [Clostridiales bacterium]|nr:lysine 2,3-aminomutase [Clostridiales bacterium]
MSVSHAQNFPKAGDERFNNLKNTISDYLDIKGTYRTGIEDQEKIAYQKKQILKLLNATQEQWKDYRWQFRNRFTGSSQIAGIIGIRDEELKQLKQVEERFRFAISPYYLSLIDPEDPNCAIRRQSVPSVLELDEKGSLDPMDEQGSSPQEYVTRRYPDRLIIKVTNICGMYCRFCQRRRLIGQCDTHTAGDSVDKAVAYVSKHPEIRDVLITGGDALSLDDASLERILSALRDIRHVEIIRIGSRLPVTLPQRITGSLVQMLKKYHPLYVNTHFNHPREITGESKRACEMLADAGIPLGNQMVLLNGVNNDKFLVRKLNQELLRIRVKPYYIFHPKTVRGTSHFWVTVQEGMEIIESLRGRTSGMAVPSYIVNGPGGLGKTPILPNYMLCMGKNKAVFRNWEGKVFEIRNG